MKHKKKLQNINLKKIALDKKLLRQTHSKPKSSALTSTTTNTNSVHNILDHSEPRVLDDLDIPYTTEALRSLLKTVQHSNRMERRKNWSQDLLNASIKNRITKGDSAIWEVNKGRGIYLLGKNLQEVWSWWNT